MNYNALKSMVRANPELGSLTQFGITKIRPSCGLNIIHELNRYDGVLSGLMRWNGGVFYFDTYNHPVQEPEYVEYPSIMHEGRVLPSEIERETPEVRHFAALALDKDQLDLILRKRYWWNKLIGGCEYDSDGNKLPYKKGYDLNAYDAQKIRLEQGRELALNGCPVVAWFNTIDR